MATSELYPIIAVFFFTVAICGAVYAGWERGYRPMHRRMRDLAVRIRVTEGLYEEPDQVGDLVSWVQKQLPDPNVDKPAVARMAQTLQHAGFYRADALKL